MTSKEQKQAGENMAQASSLLVLVWRLIANHGIIAIITVSYCLYHIRLNSLKFLLDIRYNSGDWIVVTLFDNIRFCSIQIILKVIEYWVKRVVKLRIVI